MTKNIFFRNDDVWELDNNLINLVDIFLEQKIPLHLSIIPGKLTENCISYLKKLKSKQPKLIEFGQHGFKHIDHSKSKDKFAKYEFGRCRTYEQQKEDIICGREIMDSININSRIFIPPWHGFNDITLQILKELGYFIISTDQKSPVLNKTNSLKSVPTGVYLNKRTDMGWYIEKNKKILAEIYHNPHVKIGIQIHHKSFNNPEEFDQLRNLLQKLTGDSSINFIHLSK
jgi:predicted deacetylase